MKTVNTVLGPLPVSELGVTSMHEHFVYGFPGHQSDTSVDCFREERDLPRLLKTAERFKALGYRTVVDATVADCGRDVELLRKISRQTGLQIICVSGWYAEMYASPGYWVGRQSMGADIAQEIYDMFITETQKGIAGTDIRAGMLKASSSLNAITEYEKVFFRAVGAAQKATGLPVTTHADGATMGREQAELLIGNGAAPHKVVIGHMCGLTDLKYLEGLLALGVNLGFDRFGIEGFDFMKTATDAERVDTLLKLLGLGYEDQIVLGHDTVDIDLGRPFTLSPAARKFKDHSTPAVIHEYVLPRLRQAGITQGQIDKLMVENPAKLFS